MKRGIGVIICSPIMMGKAFWSFHIMILIRNLIELLELSIRGETQFANYFSYLMLIYVMFVVIAYTTTPKKISIILSLVLLVGCFEASALIFKNNAVYIQGSLLNVLISFFPYYIVALGIIDFDDLEERMERYFPLYILLAWLLLLFAYTGVIRMQTSDYMKIAYDVMIPIGISGYLATKHRDARYYILFIVSATALLFIGCRGAFAAVLAVFLMSLFMIEKNKRMRLITIMLAVLLVVFFKQIIELADFLLGLIGYDSRIITRINTASFFQSSGREVIRTHIMGYAGDHGYKMFGIFGDRYLGGLTMNSETYIHNIALEFVIDYGIYLGIALLVLLTVMIITHWKRATHSELVILSVFTTMMVVKLMVSSSYLTDPTFFSFLGLQLSVGNLQRKRNLQ